MGRHAKASGRRPLGAVVLLLSCSTLRTTAAQPADGGRVAVSTHDVLVVMPDGSLWCQGRNHYNQCAPQDSSADGIAQLTLVRGAPRALDVALSDPEFSLVLGVDGRVYAWGRNLSGVFGGDGRNRVERRTRPTPVAGLREVVAIADCNRAAAALEADGTVWIWGSDETGVMGTGRVNGRYESSREYHEAVPVRGVRDVAQIACGDEHMLARTRDGAVWSWGANRAGQLGHGDTVARGVPTRINGLANVAHIDAVHISSIVRRTDGSWHQWGPTGLGAAGPCTARRPVVIGRVAAGGPR